ncbi:DNA polymerase [Lacticaseibacillus pabuli]|uniref:DNA polymerase n=1 Tax=Lacticaseibacillus pabuli TaxID=3025672 RepID=A0ABY7WVL2_9LACO|nr:DNA polymerase [Lacticaseibacillus sp. KACC 23028]WDF83824.1 DNA polymerase [Lacticaseibacillus sp. KACC 23028]
MCIDCKSFYASVEAIRRAEYPLAAKNAVLSREESAGGLILAASPYCKANYGVRLGTRRFELRPDMDIQIVEPHMADYIKINYRINEIYRHYTDDAHWYVYSIDESFIDVTASHSLFGSNAQMATRIQDDVFQATGIITTVGIGDNPLLAKLALDNAAKEKAPWQATWTYRDVPQTIWRINKLTDFWSIGSRTAVKLQAMGIDNLYDVAHTPIAKLHKKFGVLGDALYYHSWGIDYSMLTRRYHPRNETRGFGNSQVLMRDYVTRRDCETVLAEIADQVATRLRKNQLVGSVVSIGVGFGEPDPRDGRSGFGAQVHVEPTNRTNEITRAVWYLFNQHWDGQVIRSAGVRVSKLNHPESEQISLFEPVAEHDRVDQLELTIDRIRKRFGFKALVRASSRTAGGTAIDRAGMVGGHQA